MPESGVACDLSQRFVRELRESADGLVAFEFAIGWPDMAVELAMPRPLFEAFCRQNQVQHLSPHGMGDAHGAAALPWLPQVATERDNEP
jgi:phenol hydroxylase P0 protein